jgi:hypothetical protein|tara:strand:+ start:168 stop:443 length:276 start_codon:yes stop_codon:yes gene_type:complete
MSNFEMFLLWGIFGGPFVACVTYLYGGICIKSIEDRQFVIFLMCLPAALIAVFLVPWSGGSFQSFIPISTILLHWFLWFHEDFMKLLEGKN